MNDSFYRTFEDKHRGDRDLIKSRLQVYLPFITPLLGTKKDSSSKAVDLGCGRGEWLELLTEQGFVAQGVDTDKGMLEACWERNLQAEMADAEDYLRALKNNSKAIISGFHIVEHIPFEKLQTLVEQALRILKPGGLLILETPNPENIVVGTANFYLDPTHHQPLPPLLLTFIAEYSGFERVKVLRLQEPEGLLKSENLTLLDVLSGVSPDYSIIAQKAAAKNTLKKFDAAYSKEYGVSLHEIANIYDRQLNNKTETLKIEQDTERQRADQLALELNAIKDKKDVAEALREQLVQDIKFMEKHLEAVTKEKAELGTEHRVELDRERQRADQLALELNAIKDKKNVAEALREQLVQDVKFMEKHLEEVTKEKAELTTEHRVELDRERQRADQLALELNVIREKKEIAEVLKEQQFAELTEIKEQHELLIVHSQCLQNKWDEAKIKINELNHSSHHWYMVADTYNKEIQNIYGSKSWRITWPFRKLNLFLKYAVSLPRRLLIFSWHIIKSPFRYIILAWMKKVLRNDKKQARAIRVLSRFPRIKARLKIINSSYNSNISISEVQKEDTSDLGTSTALVNIGSEQKLEEEVLKTSLLQLVDKWKIGKRLND